VAVSPKLTDVTKRNSKLHVSDVGHSTQETTKQWLDIPCPNRTFPCAWRLLAPSFVGKSVHKM